MKPFITISHISKSYGPLSVLSDVSLQLCGSLIYCVSAPSGAGKTTLFRLIMGLEPADSGQILLPDNVRFSAVFQEDCLIEHLSPMENIQLAAGGNQGASISENSIRRELSQLLPEESLSRPVCTLSGGMKRRCAFLRAMISPSDIVIMDEPFTGLDEDTKGKVIDYLLMNQNNRLILIATHQQEDIKKLGATVLCLDNSQP